METSAAAASVTRWPSTYSCTGVIPSDPGGRRWRAQPLRCTFRSGKPTATIFIDESGSRSTAGKLHVIAAIKLREPGRLARSVRAVRDRHSFDKELKFSTINQRALPVCQDVIRALEVSDATIAAPVEHSSRGRHWRHAGAGIDRIPGAFVLVAGVSSDDLQDAGQTTA